MATIAEALAIATDHHQAGRLAEAETLYRRILEADPENPAVLHRLGVLAAQCGAFEAAADLIGQAIRHNAGIAEYHRHHAMALDRLGRTEDAAGAYAAAAELAPGHADTLFNLGVVLDRLGRRDAAAIAYGRALEADPRHAAAANNRGLALRALGRVEEAIDSFAQAGRADPGFGAAWYHRSLAQSALGRSRESAASLRLAVLGDPSLAGAHVNLANHAQEAADTDVAARHYRHALRIDPTQTGAWRGLAQELHRQGRPRDAADAFAEALRHGEGEPVLWNALGTCRLAAGDAAGAVSAFRRWSVAEPDDAEAQFALAVAAAQAEAGTGTGTDIDLAETAYRRTARLLPTDHRPWVNLALLRIAAGRLAEALSPLRMVLALRPHLAEPWYNLGHTLRRLERASDGVAAYRRAIILRPDDGAAAFNRALDLQELGRIAEAADGYRHTLALDPIHVDALCSLASLVRASARYAEATAGYRRALAIQPASVASHRNLLSSILYDPGWSEAMRYAEHRRFEALHALPLYAQAKPPACDPDPGRRLRVGYLSADFREHPVARNLEPILANHDRERVHVTAYADVARPDAVTDRFRAHVQDWRSIGGLDDRTVAERIRADRIDVLVILAGRFDANRPLVAAHRPAPVQISLYDAATSGLSAIDAILTDRVMTPRHGPERFAERPIRLPTLFAYAPIADAPPVVPPPHLAHGGVTFGSFNNPAKQSDEVLALWARVLAAVPGSRLVLKYKNLYAAPALAERARRIVEAAGVDPARLLTPAAVQERQHHLALYNGVDIALDPFPFCGATTSFEALWMGVPVVTLPGGNMMSRWSASLLSAIGLPDLIAVDPDGYVRIATDLAADPARLSDLRAGLRGRMEAASFLDGRLKARQFERVYRALWRRWCARHDATG
ncbi:O-linked N-acetylglucosamine transferase family protein [Azospirillum agricola]|uniref:O-linked N-acetylglucosamine transferase family protein n=1 Tax=Azospirillum agricola TaxID=1720247 RepID=UPI000A0F2E0F|nr:tetratricopeptide repeat protein [Azospirillum agricola]SMH45390.1 Predicted O-linked N-acetylglucosamine transferase, SPINDLY family [Azospirillum lipoferum]